MNVKITTIEVAEFGACSIDTTRIGPAWITVCAHDMSHRVLSYVISPDAPDSRTVIDLLSTACERYEWQATSTTVRYYATAGKEAIWLRKYLQARQIELYFQEPSSSRGKGYLEMLFKLMAEWLFYQVNHGLDIMIALHIPTTHNDKSKHVESNEEEWNSLDNSNDSIEQLRTLSAIWFTEVYDSMKLPSLNDRTPRQVFEAAITSIES
jgi:hypothetical protein